MHASIHTACIPTYIKVEGEDREKGTEVRRGQTGKRGLRNGEWLGRR